MKVPAVKGTRDFYPEAMAVRNRIIDGWKQVSIRNGFEEYDGPIFDAWICSRKKVARR